MKAKFLSLIAGGFFLVLASGANADQLLNDKQMDSVVAGYGNWTALANAAAVALGNFDSITYTATNTYTSQVENVAVAQSTATGQAASAITYSIVAVGSNAAAACVGGC